MRTLFREVRLAARSLRKAPGFSLGVIAALALGIGANTAIFSVANALLFRPLPLRQEGEIVHVSEWRQSNGDLWGFLSPSDFALLLERRDVFAEMAASVRSSRTVLVGLGRPEELVGREISPELFSLAGIEPILGRRLLPADAVSGAPRTILVSSKLWHRRFGGRPEAVGRPILLNNELFEIVGVMPPDWGRADDSDFWMAYRLAEDLPNHVKYLDGVIARLKPGLSLEKAQAAVDAMAESLGRPGGEADRRVSVRLVPIRRHLVGDFWNPLLVLIGAAGLVLLLACANAANLLLGRAAGRQSELAVRKAVGASTGNLLAHSLAEALVLAAAGTALALPLAAWGTRLLAAAAPAEIWQLSSASLDGRVLAYGAGLALVTAAVSGLLPSLWAARIAPAEALSAGRGAGRSPFDRRGVGGILVVAEIALALPLLVAAGLMIQSLWRLGRADLGLTAENLVVGEIWLPRYKYPEEPPRREFFRQLLERVRRQPGVESTGTISFLPVGPFGSDHRPVRLPGSATPRGEAWEAMEKVVDGGYFRTVGIPLLRGRTFTERDDERSESVAIVTDSCGQHFFPSGDAVGRSLEVWFPGNRWDTLTIVGVVGDVVSWPEARIDPGIYLPYRQRVVPTMSLLVRGSSGTAAVERIVRREVAALDPDQLVEPRPLKDALAGEIAASRFLAFLLKMFAALALLLAATGTSSVMYSLVARRRSEIGIRTALGARRSDVVGLFVRQSLRWAAIGVAIGGGVAMVSSRSVASLLFGVRPHDTGTLAIGAVVLLAAAAAGAYLPARAGARVDPMMALRSE